jgi:nitrate/nitrite transporter NarK
LTDLDNVDAPWVVVAIMALAFFGKGVGALGWAVIPDTCPKQIAGLSGGLFNMFGNLSSISTPIIIGYIIQSTGSFNDALVFVGANALVAASSYFPAHQISFALRASCFDPVASFARAAPEHLEVPRCALTS